MGHQSQQRHVVTTHAGESNASLSGVSLNWQELGEDYGKGLGEAVWSVGG
jgi:hypothetical protein